MQKVIFYVLWIAGIIFLCNTVSIIYAKDAEVLAQDIPVNWGLSYPKPGEPPVTNASKEVLKEYDAIYIGNEQQKELYLTFNAGYENGYTPKILATLKKHQVSATFFIVGTVMKNSPETVRQIVADGHTVGNHSFLHKDIKNMTEYAQFKDDVHGFNEMYKEIIGEEPGNFYRPPSGQLYLYNLQHAKQAGFKTFYFSIAYADWDNNKQPSQETAFKTLTNRLHNGAIIMLHSTSKTNSEVLDSFITYCMEQGYVFKSLEYIG